jgi:hypothetical protein
MAVRSSPGRTDIPWEAYHSPNFIHPDFAPYVPQQTFVRGRDGSLRPVKTYGNHVVGSGFRNLDPSVLRMGRGRSFMLKYPNDPCPAGWVRDQDRAGVCVEAPSYDGTFYSPLTLPFSGGNPLGPPALPLTPREGRPTSSAPGDVRVANTRGGYDVTYESKPNRSRIKAYVSNEGPTDGHHYATAQPGYAKAPTSECLL